MHARYLSIIGGPARSSVWIWLIASSLYQRDDGQCEYRGIELNTPGGGRVAVL